MAHPEQAQVQALQPQEQAQEHAAGRQCQRVPSVRSGAKRVMRSHSTPDQLTLQQQQQQDQQAQRNSYNRSNPNNNLESMRTTLPRVTTTVTMTPTLTTTASASGRALAGTTTATTSITGSASEQDEVEVRGLPSPGWKRARVQQVGSRENLAQATAVGAPAPNTTRRNTTSNGSNGSNGNTRTRALQELQVQPIDVSDNNEGLDASSEDELEIRPSPQEVTTHAYARRSTARRGLAVTQANSSSPSGAGSRRGSQTLSHQHDHCIHPHHRHRHHVCSAPSSTAATANASMNMTSVAPSHRSLHQTHTRNYSSPSLLDSFTSPEPMLSPIQSYFGSDPNSPASSFSLPRHDHYPRLTMDPAASMDGYHGFATHPWSEHSTTPSRAFSHRWTRRLSQSDAYPTQTTTHSTINALGSSSDSRLDRTSNELSRPFAPAAMDRPWDATSVAVSRVETSQPPDETLDGEEDDMMQESTDEATMDESFGGYESTYGHRFDYNRNLRNSDDDEELDEEDSYPYGFRAQSIDLDNGAEGDHDENDELEQLDYPLGLDREGAEPDQTGDMDESEDEAADEMTEDEDGEGPQLSLNHYVFAPSSLISSASSRSRPSHAPSIQTSPRPLRSMTESLEGVQVGSSESDEALARRLQEEEYTAMLGERSAMADFDRILSRYESRRPRQSIHHRTSVERYRLADETAFAARQSEHYLPSSRSLSSARRREQELALRGRSSTSSNNDIGSAGNDALSRMESRIAAARERDLARRRSSSGYSHSTNAGANISSTSTNTNASTSTSTINDESLRWMEEQISATLSGTRSAFIASRATMGGASRHDRPSTTTTTAAAVREGRARVRSRSPATRLAEAERDYMLLAQAMEMRFHSQRHNSNMDNLWGNPADYLNDDQVDESYEGLLRLSERIGDAKPKGVPARVLKMMDNYVVSWKQMKGRDVTLSLSRPTSTLELEQTTTSFLQQSKKVPTPLSSPSSSTSGSISTRSLLTSLSSSSSRDSLLQYAASSNSRPQSPTAVTKATAAFCSLLTRPSTLRSRSDLTDSGSLEPSFAEDSVEENCTICLQVYEMSDRVRPLPCRHAFHKECIDTWLRGNAQCPICRQEVTEARVESMIG